MKGLNIARWVQSLQRARQPYKGYYTFGSLQRQAEGRTEGIEALEAEAMAVEGVFREVEEVNPSSPDIEGLTEKVYQLLKREMRIEHERRGGDQF